MENLGKWEKIQLMFKWDRECVLTSASTVRGKECEGVGGGVGRIRLENRLEFDYVMLEM